MSDLPPRRRPRISQILEIETAKGCAYAHYVYRSRHHGHLLRVTAGLFGDRPLDMAFVAALPTLFWAYFALGAALWHRLVTVVGAAPVPPGMPPLMRTPSIPTVEGRVPFWLLHRDGADMIRVYSLTPEQDKLSITSSMPYPDLVEEIEHQRGPEHWFQLDRVLRRNASTAAPSS